MQSKIFFSSLVLVITYGFLINVTYAQRDRPPINKNSIENNKFSSESEKNRTEHPIFQWDEYKTQQDMANALRKILPIGTDKSAVDKILLSQSGAKATEQSNVASLISKSAGVLESRSADKILYSDPKFKNVKTFVRYTGPYNAPMFDLTPGTSRLVTVYYDHEDKLLNITVYMLVVHTPQSSK